MNNAAPPSFSPVYGRSAYGAGGPTDYAAVDAQSSEDLQGGTSMDGFSRFNGYYDDPTPPPTHSRYHSRNFSSNSFQSLNSQGAIAMSPPQNSGAYPPGPVPDYYRQGAPYDQSGSPSRLPPGAAGPGRNSPSQQNPYDGRRHYSRPSQDSLGRYH